MEQILKPDAFVRLYKKLGIKFWHKLDSGDYSIKLYQLINFVILKLFACKVRINQTTHLAVKYKNIVELIDIETLSQKLIHYVKFKFPDEKGVINKIGILDALLEKSIKFYNQKILNYLPIFDITVNTDTKDRCDIAYNNFVIRITKETTLPLSYESFHHNILKSQIIQRDFTFIGRKLKGEFAQLVWDLANHSLYRFKVLCCVIGYLAHRYKDPANPKMVILIDQVIGELETANGGSCKSLFVKGISYIRNVVELSGKKLKSDSRFGLQRTNIWTDIILVNDASKTENLENWYNITADGYVKEEKYKKEEFIPFEYSPKIALTSNHMIKRPEGNSSERRVHEVEISDYYGGHLSPRDKFGHILFADWNSEEWIQYDNFMVFCIQYYLQFGLLTPPKINILKRKLIAEVGIELIEFMDDKISQGITKFHKKDTYDEFVKGGFINRKYIPQRNSFTRKLKKYFEYKELNYTEVPSDSKKYFELITDEKMEEITTQTLQDKQVDYKLVDTPNKLTRFNNTFKNL